MTKKEYDVFLDDLDFHPENAFIYKGTERYFIHVGNDLDWCIEKGDSLEIPCKYTLIKEYDTLDELLVDKIIYGKAVSEIYEDIEPTDY